MVTTVILLTESEPQLAASEQVKHTSGPWFVERSEQHRSFISSNCADNAPIKNGGIYIAHALGKDHEPNARLIAAAPDMLTELRECAKMLTTLASFESDKEVKKEMRQQRDAARAAIAKAEGRTP